MKDEKPEIDKHDWSLLQKELSVRWVCIHKPLYSGIYLSQVVTRNSEDFTLTISGRLCFFNKPTSEWSLVDLNIARYIASRNLSWSVSAWFPMLLDSTQNCPSNQEAFQGSYPGLSFETNSKIEPETPPRKIMLQYCRYLGKLYVENGKVSQPKLDIISTVEVTLQAANELMAANPPCGMFWRLQPEEDKV